MPVRGSLAVAVLALLLGVPGCDDAPDPPADADATDADDADADVHDPDADADVPDAGEPDAEPDADPEPPIGACYRCHGDEAITAPPPALDRSVETTSRHVGAHRAHLLGDASWHRPVLCEDCHLVPLAYTDPGHLDDPPPADITWGAASLGDGATPAWDGTSCAGVHCHGATVGGGTDTSPAWAGGDGFEASCGSCHSIPPPPPHTVETDCSTCHPHVAADRTFVEPARHIDGVVDRIGDSTCTICHGSGDVAAPPPDTSGVSETSARGVGAHRSHVDPSPWHAQLDCAACHVKPVSIDDVGHRDSDLPAELQFGWPATAWGVPPVWDGATCTVNYCHGALFPPGGTVTTPVWTTVDGTQSACGSCHGLPPADPHYGYYPCTDCHVTSDGTTIFFPEYHIDGWYQ